MHILPLMQLQTLKPNSSSLEMATSIHLCGLIVTCYAKEVSEGFGLDMMTRREFWMSSGLKLLFKV